MPKSRYLQQGEPCCFGLRIVEEGKDRRMGVPTFYLWISRVIAPEDHLRLFWMTLAFLSDCEDMFVDPAWLFSVDD